MTATGWHEVNVGGRDCAAFAPPQPAPDGATVLYLHDAAQQRLADHPPFSELFARYGLRCLAPRTGRSWWTDRVCSAFDPSISAERYVLEQILPWLADEWSVTPPRIALLGVEMGGQGALRLSYKRPETFPVVAAIAPAIDYHLRYDRDEPALRQLYRDAEQARQDSATLHIHPLNWPRQQWFGGDPADPDWFDGADRLRMKLWSLGVPHVCDLETTVDSPGWDYAAHMADPAIRFLVEGLAAESRRWAN